MRDEDFHYSTDAEWDQAEARDAGQQNPHLAWVLTDRDVWHKNPFYKGPPVPHPEDDYGDEPQNDGYAPDQVRKVDNKVPDYDDEIPF